MWVIDHIGSFKMTGPTIQNLHYAATIAVSSAVSTQYANVTDNRQTHQDGKGRAYA